MKGIFENVWFWYKLENWVHSILIEKESLVVLALYANQSLLFFWQQVTVKEN